MIPYRNWVIANYPHKNKIKKKEQLEFNEIPPN